MQPPEPPSPLAAAAPPPPPEDGEDPVVAKRKLMSLIRARPEVLRALQLRVRADDSSVMKALGKFNNIFEVLRLAGCTIPEATKGEQLWDLAVQAPKVRPPKRSKAWIWYSIGGVVACLILIFLAIIVIQLTQANQGLEIGTCFISLFTNSTCIQEGGTCLVEVAVRSADMFLVKSGWSLPIEHTGPSGDYTTYYGDPFRCCNDNEGRVPSCCDLVSGGVEQRTAETFCDAWGSQGKVDYAGKPCNFGSWPCLFNVVPGGPTGDMIGELMYFVEPDVSSYVAVVIGLSVILLLLVLAPWLMKRCRCDCNLNLLQEEEEAELYDPDDPASDWGQAVQEALQEEYQRKLEGGCCAKLAAYMPHREKLKSLSRVTRVLCALCRRKKTDQVSEASPEGERSSRRSASKISQGRESRSSKTLPQVSDKTPVEAEPLGVSRQSQSLRQSQAEPLGVSRQSQSLRQSQAEPLGVSRQSQSLRQSQARQVLIETDEEEKAPPPIVPVSLPPGFIYDEISDVEGVKKYQKWDSLDKEATDFTETDIHPGFQLGNLSSVARVAQQQRQSLFMPIVEPIPRAAAKAYTTNTLHYCSSSFRESRRKKRPERSKNIKKRPGGAHEGPGKLNWAQDVGGPTGFMQQNQMFRNLHGKGNHRPSTSPTMLE